MDKKASVDSVVVGRVLAGIVIAVSFAFGNRLSVEADGHSWSFLYVVSGPMGIGFLIIMVTEVVRELRRGNR